MSGARWHTLCYSVHLQSCFTLIFLIFFNEMFSSDTGIVNLAWILFDKNKSRKSGPLAHAVPILCYPLVVLSCFSLITLKFVICFYKCSLWEYHLFIFRVLFINQFKWIITCMGNYSLNNTMARINHIDVQEKMVLNQDVSYLH